MFALGAVLATIAMLGSLAAWVGGVHFLGFGSCHERQAEGYSQMEATIEEALAELTHEGDRVDACRDTGEPETVIDVTVPEWHSRRIAIQYFKDRGWSPDGNVLINPDDDYAVGISTTILGADDDGPTAVTVRFRQWRRT